MPARSRIAGVVEEDDAEVGAAVVGRHDEAPVHVRMSTWLEDEQPPRVVEPLGGVAAPLEDRCAARRLDAFDDDAERLAARVVVDRADRGGCQRSSPCRSSTTIDPTILSHSSCRFVSHRSQK